MEMGKNANKYITQFLIKKSKEYNVDINNIYLIMKLNKDNNVKFNLMIDDIYEKKNNKICTYTLSDIIGYLTYNLLKMSGYELENIIIDKVTNVFKNNNVDIEKTTCVFYSIDNNIIIDIYKNNEFIHKTKLN